MINESLARKVLETVDAGLCRGLGQPVPGHMCVEAAVCFAMGLPHSDEPTCVSGALRSFKIKLNDAPWSSNESRAKGMRRLAIAQLGTAGALDDIAFARSVALLAKKWGTSAAAEAAARAAAAEAAEAAAEAADAAPYAAEAAAAAARDSKLSECAEDVVYLLISLNAPGCEFLYLTE